jgi:hypothetical protein
MSEQKNTQQNEAALSASALFGSPLVRITVIIAVLVLAVACVAFVVFNQQQSSRHKPLDVEVYANAALEVQNEGLGYDETWYITEDDANLVVNFYNETYNDGRDLDNPQNQEGDQTCVKLEAPRDASGALVDPSQPPFQVRCVVDHSTINARQDATITIQPHTSGDYAGMTIIYVERRWQE